MKNIVILGASGSIGKQAIEIIAAYPNEYKVIAVSVHQNTSALPDIIELVRPEIVAITDEQAGKAFLNTHSYDCNFQMGEEGAIHLAKLKEADVILNAIVGFAGLRASFSAIRASKTLALANKESLVVAGEVLMKEAQKSGSQIVPVDSEHSAIFQCLGKDHPMVEKIILTASGGPFRGYTREQLERVTLKQALKHPNWNMGEKITIDSATMMNKGLEMIEARWLFDVLPENIEMIVHKQSIIHSMVEFQDGAILAQMGSPDMKLPILYALSYPERHKTNIERVDFSQIGSLDFQKPDIDVFKCIKLAYEAINVGGTLPAIMNAANEAAVSLFLSKIISFYEIPQLIEDAMAKNITASTYDIDSIIELSESVTRDILSKY